MAKQPQQLLQSLVDQASDHQLGIVGSPSNTTEITIDILQAQEESKILGQLVYTVIPQGKAHLAVLGQVSQIETKNRWHEDMTFRGIIKRRGNLPHLSGRADVRTATISVQAVFEVDGSDPEQNIVESVLAVSPSTGVAVYRVRDEVLDTLLLKHKQEIVYLGRAYSTDVRMPLWLKHFGNEDGGAGEAYQIGVFGKTGSGKSGLAAYLLLGYARYKQMGILFIDPQGQFSAGQGLPFDLREKLKLIGRQVKTYSLGTQVHLQPDAPLFAKLLKRTNFYRRIGVRAKENQAYAEEEVTKAVKRELEEREASLDNPGEGFLEAVLKKLASEPATKMIYSSGEPLKRLISTLNSVLANANDLSSIESESWIPTLDLFAKKDSKGNPRTSLYYIINQVAGNSSNDRPIVFLDISSSGGESGEDDEIKSLILRAITSSIRHIGEQAFKKNGEKINCLIALDEAHRFAGRVRYEDDSEQGSLINSFVNNVRETRKYGLGFMFITQSLASLHPEILGQLRIKFFGHGLNMGQELAKLKEEIGGDSQALSLYTSFTDPASSTKRQFPFMVTGPASPLSFTGAPLFFQTFTDFEKEFVIANPFFRGR